MITYLISPIEEQQKMLENFLVLHNIPFVKNNESEELPEHVLKGIQQGMEDFDAGNFITHEEFKKRIIVG